MKNLLLLLLGIGVLFAVTSSSFAMGKKPQKAVLNAMAPELYLYNPVEKKLEKASFVREGKVSVICFLSYECPLSRAILEKTNLFCFDLQDQPILFTGISSMPYENLDQLKTYQKDSESLFNFHYDKDQVLAYQLGPTKAPQFFVFDAQKRFRFQGNYKGMVEAVTALLCEGDFFQPTTEVFGCPLSKARVKHRIKREKGKVNQEEAQQHFMATPPAKTKISFPRSSKNSFEISFSNSM